MTVGGGGDGENRSSVWLPLLKRLTDESPTWVVWKNVDAALAGNGDIDSAASPADWGVIEREFLRWAGEERLGAVAICRHIPGGLNMIAIPPDAPAFLELGVKATRIFRGSVLFEVDDLEPLVQMDPRGFRRIRPGAEGVFKFLLNGTRWGGRPNWDGLREKRVLELLEADPSGVEQASRLLGAARRPLLAGARSAMGGTWNRLAMASVDAWSLLRGLRSPSVLARRAWFRVRVKKACPIVRAILQEHRRIPEDRGAWIRELARTHRIVETEPSRSSEGS